MRIYFLQGPVRFYDNERKANIMLKQFQSKYTKYLQNLLLGFSC